MVDPHILTGNPTPRGCDGCLESHQAIVRKAKESGWPAVWVLEDDCQFTEAFSLDKWFDAIIWAQTHGFGCVTGGVVGTYGAKLVHRQDAGFSLISVTAFHSAHCIAYLASAYDAVLETEQPFDVSLGQKGARPLVTWPFAAVQRPAFSGILQADVNYLHLYAQHERYLRDLCRLPEPAGVV